MLRFAQPAVRNLRRLQEVQAVLLRYGFGFLLENEEIRSLRSNLGRRLHLPTEVDDAGLPNKLRCMLQELGPTFIKLGQILSSRGDFLPAQWTHELAKLQDHVPPFPFAQVQQVIREELGQPLPELFMEFEPEPFAAASIGQVHRARLMDHTPVVVKVRRPNIGDQVEADISIIFEILHQVEAHTSWGKHYGVVAIFDEFATTLRRELDYRNEATNADHLRRLTAAHPRLHVPYMYWEYITAKVLTMESIDGVKINDLAALEAADVDRIQLAQAFIKSLFQQLLIDGFYHADPHPGNLLVDLHRQQLVFIDLGMTGRIMPEQLTLLGDLVQSIIRRDSLDVTRILLNIGIQYKRVDEAGLRRAVDYTINRYLETSLDRIQFSALFTEIMGIIYTHGLRLPSEFTLGLKTIVQAEEIARTLDPQISIFTTLNEFSHQLLFKAFTPQALSDTVRDALREATRLRRVVPRALETILRQIESGTLRVTLDIPDFINIVSSLLVIANRLVSGLIITGMLIGSALAMGIPPSQTWFLIPVLGVVGFLVALLFGASLVWSVLRDIWQTEKHKHDLTG